MTRASRTAARQKPRRPERRAPQDRGTSTPAAAPEPSQTTTDRQRAPSGDDPAALNDQGYALMGQGRYGDAVPLLQRSVTAFRDQGRTGELGYAYALYNLGRSLRLAGRPADAIPYLEERLRVSDNQRDVVERELAAARAAAGETSDGSATGASAGPPGKGHGKKGKKD